MQTLENPLRRPKPARRDTLCRGVFSIADEKAVCVSSTQVYQVRLTAQELWLSSELSIPLECILSVDVITAGRLITRRALRVIYQNPITRQNEAVYLCKVVVCYYRTAPLTALLQDIEAQRELVVRTDTLMATDPQGGEEVEIQCEVCGSTPAFYVGYRILIGAVMISYLSEERRRTHCRRHNLLAGGYAYLISLFLGWIGLSIVAWPFQVYRCAQSMRPSIGAVAAHFLGVVPLAVIGSIIWVMVTGA